MISTSVNPDCKISLIINILICNLNMIQYAKYAQYAQYTQFAQFAQYAQYANYAKYTQQHT